MCHFVPPTHYLSTGCNSVRRQNCADFFEPKMSKFYFQISKEGLLSEALEKLRENINSKMSEYCEIEKAQEKVEQDAPAEKKRKKKKNEDFDE